MAAAKDVHSRKLPSSKYKGVVPQPTGRWGAQLYDKHRRIWLGTFKDEEEAAKAYHVASRRFRRAAPDGETTTIDQDDMIETAFLNSRSRAEIVDMLRKHSYFDELEQSRSRHRSTGSQEMESGLREPLFDKAVTPSDVGKLSRMVIPKQQAEKHFPLGLIRSSSSSSKRGLLNFEDSGGKIWRFRCSFWHSSRSYVLTKGWRRFVKEKKLKAGDVVSFHRSTGSDKRLFIELDQQQDKPRPEISEKEAAEKAQVVRLFGVNLYN